MSSSPQLTELVRDIREQVLYLQELGVEGLTVTLSGPVQRPSAAGLQPQHREPAPISPPPQPADEPYVPPAKLEIPKMPEPSPARRRAGSRLAALPSLSNRPNTAAPPPSRPPVVQGETEMPKAKTTETSNDNLFSEIGPALPDTVETIEDIRADIGNCVRCPLHQGRTKIVHTTGDFQAELMFVGEAPGADEDDQGVPFVGRAGQLLTKIIEAIGMSRDEVVIGNINRCRPPGNRQPTLTEAHACRPFLMREIAVIKPKVIVVLGNTAMHNLLDTKVGITKMRGQFHDYFGVKVMPTFHPAYLLRDPSKKREVWEDMKKVRDYIASTRES